MEQLYALIAGLGKKYHAEKIVLFGSRARGDNRERSDIDLAVYGMPEQNRPLFWSDVDDLPTLLKFDLVHITAHTDPALAQIIEKEGVTLYEQSGNKNHSFFQGCCTAPGRYR